MINGITTLALIASVGLLVRALPSHKKRPLELLPVGRIALAANVIVFALVLRLDGGDQLRHEARNLAAPAFFSRKCRSPRRARQFRMHALATALHLIIYSSRSTQSSTFGRLTRPLLARWPKCCHDSVFLFRQHRDPAHFARRRRALTGASKVLIRKSRNPGNVSELEKQNHVFFYFSAFLAS